MTRINTNIQNLIAKRTLDANNSSLTTALNRLSTGLRINTGKDDPAGLIASEGLRASKVAITAAIDNARRADNVVGIAEAGLQEIATLLLELEDLVDRSANEAGLSDAERDANQLQIDSILSSINRIAGVTAFNGENLLDGNYDFTTSAVNTAQITSLQVNSAKIPDGSYRTVTVQVLASAQAAEVIGAGTGAAGALASATTLEVRGVYGTDVLSFGSGTTLADIATAVNGSQDLTGVKATASSSGDLYFNSTGYGSEALVEVSVIGNTGDFTFTGQSMDYGVDPTVTINGANATARGLEAAVISGTISLELILEENFAQTTGTAATFYITGGGAQFAISPELGLIGRETIGIGSVSTSSLGNGSVGFLSTLTRGAVNDIHSRNFHQAQRIVREAQDQISSLRGRIGAFQKDTLQTTVNSLLVAYENTAAAESAIRDTDFAVETSALTRAQILVQSNLASLKLANQLPQNALSLLG
ncbi:MAG: flagellin [Phycisphaerales bacterium]|nr:MAG: flagellin [Phycisphaerales bacterium]